MISGQRVGTESGRAVGGGSGVGAWTPGTRGFEKFGERPVCPRVPLCFPRQVIDPALLAIHVRQAIS